MTDIHFRSNSRTHRWLSNFYMRQVVVPLHAEGRTMSARSAEHAYQALKSSDLATRETVLRQPTALQAMRIGRLVSLRSDYDPRQVMQRVIEAKFSDPDLRKLLLSTADALLIEDNRGPWGGRNGGANWLGNMLMELRTKIREED